MLQLRVFGEQPAMDTLVQRLSALDGAHHITRHPDGNGGHRFVVMADVEPAAADTVLAAASAVGLPAVDIALLRVNAIQPGRRPRDDVVWADLLGLAGRYALLEVRFLVMMAVAGVIA